MGNFRRGAKVKNLKKKHKNARKTVNQSKLERTLALDLVQSRDRIEGELATVRPIPSKKLKKKTDLLAKVIVPKVPPTPKAKEDPLNPRNESRKQVRARLAFKKGEDGPGPAGPGVHRRAKEIKSEGAASKLIAAIRARRRQAA